MELEWLRGVDELAVLSLVRLLQERTMRVPLSLMSAMTSSSRLSGRGGRCGGGPARLVKGTVAGISGIGGLKKCGRRTGREMDTLTP
jgi:hypothetical protein